MAPLKSPPEGQERFPRVFSEEDARRTAQQHVAELKRRRRRPAEARPLRGRRWRALGRFLVRWGERLVLGTEWLWRQVVTPRHRLGRLLRRLWFTLQSFANLPLLFALGAFVVVTLSRFGPLQLTPGSAGDAIGAALFGATLVGAIAAAWNDVVRCPYQARRVRRRIAQHPWCVLPTTGSARQAELSARDDETPIVPREDLFGEVLPGILDRRRSDVQMVVGEPGAGKTTALVGLAERLARIGIVPVLVPIWGEMPRDLIETAKLRFKRNAESLIGSEEQLDAVWRWLRRQRRVVVFIDDLDRVAPDGERGFMLRRALDELAGANLPAVVTTRPSGIPAGLAASAIDLGELDPAAAVAHVLRVAGDEGGSQLEDRAGAGVRGRVAQWIEAGKFAEVPFYLELLARLVAAGRCEELPPPAAVLRGTGNRGRAREREDGHCEWNPLWVRYMILDQFYREVETGRVHRWLAIERRERRSCLRSLEEVAMATLGASAMRTRRALEGKKATVRVEIEDFLDSDDRGAMEGVERLGVSAHEVVDTGERLRILDRDSSGELHFHHRIMQAYLAGRCLVEQQGPESLEREDWIDADPPDWIGALLDRCHPERLTAQMTLTFAALCASDNAPPRPGGEPHPLVGRILRRCLDGATRSLEGPVKADSAEVRRTERLNPLKPFHPEQRRADPDDALAKLTTAAEIARATQATTQEEKDIIDGVRGAHGTTMWTKLHAIPSIAALSCEGRWLCMWDFARDPDQEVRRAASEALSEDASAAYRDLETPIRALLDRAALRSMQGRPLIPPSTFAAQAENDQGSPVGSATEYDLTVWDASQRTPRWSKAHDVPSLRALGWILPAMVSGLQENTEPPPANGVPPEESDWESPCPDDGLATEFADRKRLRGARAALEQLVVLAFQGGNSELEAAISQGFKSDAMRHARAEHRVSGPGLVVNNRRFVTDFCLDDVEYWYARLVLFQALALYTVAGSKRRVAFDTYARLLGKGREPHPFVARGARLARRAVMRHAIGSPSWSSLLWDDEGVAVSRRPSELSAATAQLVGDVTVLLNLRERAPEDSQADFPHMTELPYCLDGSGDRSEILGAGCPRTCGYGFCPLRQPPPDEPNGQRTVSRAFCRGQYEISRWRKPRWQRRIHRRVLRQFWWEMERRART
jgi:hypothetical protein